MKRVFRTLLISIATWGVVSLVFACQLKLLAQIPWFEAFRFTSLEWGIWAILTPILFSIAHRFPIESGAIRKPLLIQMLATIASLALLFIWRENISTAMPVPPAPPVFSQYTGNSHPKPPDWNNNRPHPHNGEPPPMHRIVPLLLGLPVVLLIQTAAHALRFYQNAGERKRQTIELEKRLTEAKLQAITAQLQPHFLFNAINTAAGMLYENPQLADRMLVAICDFLRDTLDLQLSKDITLEEEIQLIRRFLLIQQIRFGDKLDVRINIPANLWTSAVPPLCLQPIVENAFKHGLEKTTGPLRLSIRAHSHAAQLHIEIADNGPGLPQSPIKEGCGLQNIRARLKAQFSTAASLSLLNQDGCIVTVQLPLQVL